MTRENFYILLELDPTISVEEKIKEVIYQKRKEWSAYRNHPTKGIQAVKNLRKISEIERILLNPELRESEANKAKKILRQQQVARNKRIIEIGSFFVTNGEIKLTELEILLKKSEFKGYSKEEVLNLLGAQIKKEKEKKGKKTNIKPLDFSILNSIERNLKIIDKKDLFDFLSLPTDSSPKEIVEKADELYSQSIKNVVRSPELTAILGLLGFCKTYLIDEISIQSYTESLKAKDSEKYFDLINTSTYHTKDLSAKYYIKILDKMQSDGYVESEATYLIQEYCFRRKISLFKSDLIKF